MTPKKSLIELLDWTLNVNARSDKKLKTLQQQVADLINKDVVGSAAPSAMSIAAPASFSVSTQTKLNTRRHFIGGEEVGFGEASVVPRSYRLELSLIPMYASDITRIKIPLIDAIRMIDGLEIRLLGSTLLMQALDNINALLSSEKEKAQVEKFDGKYAEIGYGSW